MSVLIYRNLNRKGEWSIAEPRGQSSRGPVIGHAPSVVLADVRFVLKESRRQAIIRTKQREVMAWAEGELIDSIPTNLSATPLAFDPYTCDSFVNTRNGQAIAAADYVEFGAKAVARGGVR